VTRPGLAALALLLAAPAWGGEGPATAPPGGATTAASPPAGPAAPGRTQRLRLHPLEARGLSAALAGLVEARLCQALAEAGGLEVVCPEDAAAAAALARQEALLGGCASDECLRRVARATEAALEVRGRLAREGSGLRLSLTLTGPGGRRSSAQAALPAELEPLVARLGPLARQLLQPPAP
jgi:hypothetical protein